MFLAWLKLGFCAVWQKTYRMTTPLRALQVAERLNTIIANATGRRERLTFEVLVNQPGSMGGSPAVGIVALEAGFDWNAGKILLKPAKELTVLSPEDISAIRESVKKGSSWHAYQQYQQQEAEKDALREEVAQLQAQLAEKTAAQPAGGSSACTCEVAASTPEGHAPMHDGSERDTILFGQQSELGAAEDRVVEPPPTAIRLHRFMAEGLHPVTVFVEEHQPGRSRITVQSSVNAWAAFFTKHGPVPVERFICERHSRDIASRLTQGLGMRELNHVQNLVRAMQRHFQSIGADQKGSK
ncbi:hypothetical protein ACOTHJ_13090 [Achromobacter xylosoxidans]|uniref:hypothetical protein n=1 Tax=Achromobacter anxifer TaxID=1287737 RepID=UPI00155D1A4E|nr:hypothetical protein [Achromobacter anxifer]CAB5514627.1 hypothetical protein LMG26857_03686 [Achromobacter anxifer]